MKWNEADRIASDGRWWRGVGLLLGVTWGVWVVAAVMRLVLELTGGRW